MDLRGVDEAGTQCSTEAGDSNISWIPEAFVFPSSLLLSRYPDGLSYSVPKWEAVIVKFLRLPLKSSQTELS